jgi:hypothetical protein
MVEASKMGSRRSHGTSERATAVEARGPGMIVEGFTTFVLSRKAGAYASTFWRKCWNITEVKNPSFGSV